MSRRVDPRRIVLATMLVAVWCGLWGTISAANLITGLAIGAGIAVLGLRSSGNGGIRFAPLLQLGGLVLKDLATSTVDVGRTILAPSDRTDEAIVAADIPNEGRAHLLLLVVAITLTPGTAVVDAEPDTGRLYLHLLRRHDREKVTQHIRRLAELADHAFPSSPQSASRETSR